MVRMLYKNKELKIKMKEKNNDFNKICFDFQNKIVNIFNNEQNIPFLLKYYLFKDIWNEINKEKFNNDRILYSNLEPKEETVTASIDLPDEFFEDNETEVTDGQVSSEEAK